MVSSFCAISTNGTVRVWNTAYFKKDFIGKKNGVQKLYIEKTLSRVR